MQPGMQPVIHRAAWFCGNTGAGRTRHLWSTGTRRQWRFPASQLIQNCWWIVGERPRLRVFRLTQQQADCENILAALQSLRLVLDVRVDHLPPASPMISGSSQRLQHSCTSLGWNMSLRSSASTELHWESWLVGRRGGGARGARQIQNQPHGGVTLWSHVPPLIVYTTGRKTRWQHF